MPTNDKVIQKLVDALEKDSTITVFANNNEYSVFSDSNNIDNLKSGKNIFVLTKSGKEIELKPGTIEFITVDGKRVTESILLEADIIPTDPHGNKITDQKIIRNLNMAIRSIDTTVRPKVIALLEDPNASKVITNINQKTALLSALALTFGITGEEFTTISSKVRKTLSGVDTTNKTAV